MAAWCLQKQALDGTPGPAIHYMGMLPSENDDEFTHRLPNLMSGKIMQASYLCNIAVYGFKSSNELAPMLAIFIRNGGTTLQKLARREGLQFLLQLHAQRRTFLPLLDQS